MRTLSILLLSATASLALAQTPKWANYAAPADGFAVLMPGPVQVTKQSTQGISTNIYLSIGQPFVCAVSKTILPPGTKASDVAQLSAGLRSSMLATSRSTATGEHPATYAGVKGQQTEFRTSTGGTGAVWIARTPKAVYSLTFAKRTPANAAEAKRFFSSLHLA